MIDGLNLSTELLKISLQQSGEELTFNHTTEECAELIVAINHLRRGRVTKEAVAEEIADVFLMCNKLALIIGVPLVDQKVIEKSRDLAERVKAKTKQYGNHGNLLEP